MNVSKLDEDQVQELAESFAHCIQPGDLIFLEGVLGAGKSTFARFLIHSLGCKEKSAGSPTFSIVHEYKGKTVKIYHIDFYRLRSLQEIEQMGMDTYFSDPGAVVIAEWISNWPEYRESFKNYWQVAISIEKENPELRSFLFNLHRSEE